MKVKVNWDTDLEKTYLPSVVDVPDGIEEDDIADWLSDQYGWLVESWEF